MGIASHGLTMIIPYFFYEQSEGEVSLQGMIGYIVLIAHL